MNGPPKIYTDAYIKSYIEKQGLGITLLETPVNVKSIVSWRCDKCGNVFQTSFLTFLSGEIRQAEVRKPYEPCKSCRLVKNATKFSLPEEGSNDYAWLSGALTAGLGVGHKHSKTENIPTAISHQNIGILNRVARLLSTDARIMLVNSKVRKCRTHSIRIRSAKFASIRRSIPRTPPEDPVQARLWVRGYFDFRGNVEIYDKSYRWPIRRVTVSGLKATLRSILSSFRKVSGNNGGYIQRHDRPGNYGRVVSYELHFIGSKKPLAFMEWIHQHPCPPHDKRSADMIRLIREDLKRRQARRDRVMVQATLAAEYVIKSRKLSVSGMADSFGVNRLLAYAAAYGAKPQGLTASIVEKLATAGNMKVSLRREFYRIISNAAKKDGYALGTVASKVYKAMKEKHADPK